MLLSFPDSSWQQISQIVMHHLRAGRKKNIYNHTTVAKQQHFPLPTFEQSLTCTETFCCESYQEPRFYIQVTKIKKPK